jgi:GT2 family glycosyltransferase
MKNDSSALVSIIIVTIGAQDYLWHCLDSVKAQSYSNLEVIVIDNSLYVDFSAKLRQSFTFIKLYLSAQNLYYGVSLNKGIELSQGKFILCLNDDVILDAGFIQEGIRGFLIKENIGSVSGKILRGNRKTLDSTGLFLSVWRTAKERGYGKCDLGQFQKPGFIFGVNGAVAFYRKEMLEKIKDRNGYFDSRFGMFYEDLDVSWRAQKRGWLAYYIPTAVAFHVRGGSFRPDSGIGKAIARRYLKDQLHCDLIKNRYLTILKNEKFFSFLLHFIPILIYDLCVWIYVILFRPKVIRLYFSRFFVKIN